MAGHALISVEPAVELSRSDIDWDGGNCFSPWSDNNVDSGLVYREGVLNGAFVDDAHRTCVAEACAGRREEVE